MSARILLWDLENTPGLGYFWGATWKTDILRVVEPSRVMSFAAGWADEPDSNIEFRSTFHDGRQQMLQRIHDLLDEADAAVTWNGARHDSPHISTEFLREGLNPPSPYREVDLFKVARSKLKFHSNRLQYVSEELDLGSKVKHEGFDLWLKCMAGDELAWARMRRYNIGDVKVLRRNYKRLLPLIPQSMHPNANLYCDGDVCPNCESKKIQRRGYADTSVSRFPRYQCQACGKWSRGKKAIFGIDVRGAA